MEEILYLTGGNTEDKNTRQITYDEAQKMLLDAQNEKMVYKPICSIVEYREKEMYRKVIYFTFQVVAISLDTTKQVWYEKIDGEQYFIDKIVYNNYKNMNIYMELHFRNRNFSEPNLCMIKKQSNNQWEYYVADIEDTLFYRKIEFGDTETVYKDLETNFEPYLNNIQKCDKRFIRKN